MINNDPHMMAMQTRDKTMDAKKLSEEARRALAEAEQRRKAIRKPELPIEINGVKGPEPTRYGDWERKGITSDF